MSNYPPGVTGFEPQIAGYPEATLDADCDCGWHGEVDAFIIDSWGDTWAHGYTAEAECPRCKGVLSDEVEYIADDPREEDR